MTQDSTNTSESSPIIGADFGKKYSGATVVAHLYSNNAIEFAQCSVKQDADQFLRDQIGRHPVKQAFLDAPLSLPGVYRFGSPYSDYFFRQADQEAGGMSPLFLGALTARAIKLKDQFKAMQIDLIEVYPAQLAITLDLKKLGYKGKQDQLGQVVEELQATFDLKLNKHSIETWHHVDALLAALSGQRYCQNKHKTFGKEEEGMIVV